MLRTSNITHFGSLDLSGESTDLNILCKELKFKLYEGERAVADSTCVAEAPEKMSCYEFYATSFEN